MDREGTLHGDVILVASGDLSLGGRTGPGGTHLFEDTDHTYAAGNNTASVVPCDPLAGLDELSKQIVGAGVKKIDGDVLIDDRFFEPATSTGSGPKHVTAIMINDNLVDVVVTPGSRPGEPSMVKIVPRTSFVCLM